MFILNLTNDELVFRAHGETLVLVPGSNLVQGTLFSAEELERHFGDYVKVINGEVAESKEEPETNDVDVPEECKGCYADGKTPSEEDCEKCKAEKEAEALAKAEAEKKAQEEAEAKAKAEAEALAKAEAEKKAQEEAEAKAKKEAKKQGTKKSNKK